MWDKNQLVMVFELILGFKVLLICVIWEFVEGQLVMVGDLFGWFQFDLGFILYWLYIGVFLMYNYQ